MLQPFETSGFFNTKIKRNHHLQGNVQVYNLRIPAVREWIHSWSGTDKVLSAFGEQGPFSGVFFFFLSLFFRLSVYTSLSQVPTVWIRAGRLMKS